MSGTEDGKKSTVSARQRRAERLEEALRANLKRRKEQARARGGTPSRQDGPPEHAASEMSDSGDGPAGN